MYHTGVMESNLGDKYLGAPARAGNEPSYSGSARKKLGSSSARELNEPSLSLNLGLINFEPEPEPSRAWTLKNDYRGYCKTREISISGKMTKL